MCGGSGGGGWQGGGLDQKCQEPIEAKKEGGGACYSNEISKQMTEASMLWPQGMRERWGLGGWGGACPETVPPCQPGILYLVGDHDHVSPAAQEEL